MKINKIWNSAQDITPIYDYSEDVYIKVINSPSNGKKLIFSRSIIEHFEHCSGAFIGVSPDNKYMILSTELGGTPFEFDSLGITVSEERLIEAIIYTYELDFSNKTAMTFTGEFSDYKDMPFVMIKLK